ncbi:DUF3325 domain-containing protein [Bradyrhizobium sp. SK17]|nr:DUF3325 family protein [uncultured Bradyrhizobium sp.]AUC98998.1 DUF3325 domain-containing protein [Bradyrhizobium sp. SK17]
MSHVLASVLCLAGFAALAFAMRRPQREIIGRSLRSTTIRALRVAGGSALMAALGVLVSRQGLSVGLVSFSGHTSIAAGVVYCLLVGYARSHDRAP